MRVGESGLENERIIRKDGMHLHTTQQSDLYGVFIKENSTRFLMYSETLKYVSVWIMPRMTKKYGCEISGCR